MSFDLRRGTVRAATVPGWVRAAAVVTLARVAFAVGARIASGGSPAQARVERRMAWLLRQALGIRLSISGDLPDGGPYLVVALHESLVDPLVLAELPLRLRWVVRDEILDWSDVGPYLRASRQVAIRPEDGVAAYRALLDGSRRAFAAGESVVVFPQGSVLGIETRLAAGAFRAAEVLDCPLLPVVITGTHRVWEHPFRPRLRFGQEVAVHVMAPVPAATVAARGHEAVRDSVEREMKRIALSGDLPPPRRFDPDRDGYWHGYAYEIDPAFPELAARVAAHRSRSAAGPR